MTTVMAGAGRRVSSLTHSTLARACVFIKDTRAGATAIAAAAVTVMTVGATALITDHLWLVDQRDVLKSAADAATLAATLDVDHQLESNPLINDADLEAALLPVAERYVLINLAHLSSERFKEAKNTLEITLDLNRAQRTVSVTAKADLGGTLFSRSLPLLGNYKGAEATVVRAGVESETTPVEVVLAIDISTSMRKDLDGGGFNPAPGNSRMDIVKRAAKRLVDILEPDARNRVAVGIVPWSTNVRLDAATATRWAREGWARYPKRRTYPIPWHCARCTVAPVVDDLPGAPPGAWQGCFDGHRLAGKRGRGRARLPKLTADALFVSPDVRNPFAQSYFHPLPERMYRCRDTSEVPEIGYSSYICYEDHLHRAQNLCSTANPALLALNTERAAIDRAIDALAPAGSYTYSGLGVVWAQRMLDPAWKEVWGGRIHPADPATSAHTKLRKAIVLLTDGQDDDYCGRGIVDCSGSKSLITIPRADACALAKAQGTEIFVVAAMPPTGVSETLGDRLRACSSEAENPDGEYVFLNNESHQAIDSAFAAIANQLRVLRKIY